MTHEGLSYFLHDPGFHQSGVEGVAQIVKAVVANSCPADRRRPRRFDSAQRSAFEEEHESFFLPSRREEFKETGGERDFPRLTARRFRVSDKEESTREIDV